LLKTINSDATLDSQELHKLNNTIKNEINKGIDLIKVDEKRSMSTTIEHKKGRTSSMAHAIQDNLTPKNMKNSKMSHGGSSA
jgi:hypothetical protein